MWIVYKGVFSEVCVPSVGDVVLKRGVPEEIADTERSRGLLLSEDFEEVSAPEFPAEESEEVTAVESAEDDEEDVI